MTEGLNPIATEVVYEDAFVRVWRQVVPAGAFIETAHNRGGEYRAVLMELKQR